MTTATPTAQLETFETSESAARERILDGAEDAFADKGIEQTRVHHVADLAACSRATVYRYFANKDALIRGVMLRQAARLVDGMQAVLAAHRDDPREATVRAALFAIDAIPRQPQLAIFFNPEDLATTSRLLAEPGMVFDIARSVLDPLLEQAAHQGLLRPEIDRTAAAEWVVRSALSFLSLPSPASTDPERLEEMLRTFLLPALFVTT